MLNSIGDEKMKKIVGVIALLLVLLTVVGCGQQEVVEEPVVEEPEPVIVENIQEELKEQKNCLETINVKHSFEIDDWSAETYMVINGEIKNSCDQPTNNIQIHFVAYDKEGTILADGYLTYPDRPVNIPAGGTAKFEKMFGDQFVVMNLDKYEVTAEKNVVLEGIKIR